MKNLRSKYNNRNPKGDTGDIDRKSAPLHYINSINENTLVKLILSPEKLLENLANSGTPIEQTMTTTEMSTTTADSKLNANDMETEKRDISVPTSTDTNNEIEMINSQSEEFMDHQVEIMSDEDFGSDSAEIKETVEIIGEMIEELINKEFLNKSDAIEEDDEELVPIADNDQSTDGPAEAVTDAEQEIFSDVLPTELPNIIKSVLPSALAADFEVKSEELPKTDESEMIDNGEETETGLQRVSVEETDADETKISAMTTESLPSTTAEPITELPSPPTTTILTESELSFPAEIEEIVPDDDEHHMHAESEKIEIYVLPDEVPKNDIEPFVSLPKSNEEITEQIDLATESPESSIGDSTERFTTETIATDTATEYITEPHTEPQTEPPSPSYQFNDDGPSPVFEADGLTSAIDSPEITIWPNAPAKLPFQKNFFKKVPSLFRPTALSSRRSAIDDSLTLDLHNLLKQMRKFRPQLKPRHRKRAIGDEGSLDNIIRPQEMPSITSAPVAPMTTPLQSYEHYFQNSGQSSLEQAEQFEKGLQRIVQFVQIAAHIDSYLTSRFKSGIKTIAKMMESEEVSNRRLRRYSF